MSGDAAEDSTAGEAGAGGGGEGGRADTGGVGGTGTGGGAGVDADAGGGAGGGSIVVTDAASDGTPDADIDDGAPAASLSSPSASHDFGPLEVDVVSDVFTWPISNTGSLATGPIVVTNDNPTELNITNGCTGSLAPGGGCSVAVTFRPSTNGARTASLTVSATPGGSLALSLTARGQFRVTVTTSGSGSVTSAPSGIDCGAACSALVDPGILTLSAHTANGSDFLFSGWSDGGCPGPFRDCTLIVTGSLSVSATFSPMTANAIFMTAATFPANLGSATSYDAKCNQAATAAGINDLSGTAYVAFISDAGSLGKDRLGTARGWVRMDGMPFADTQSSLFREFQVFSSIRFDENGAKLNAKLAFTGAAPDGALSPLNCSNWTTNSDGSTVANTAMYGSSAGGPTTWMSGSSNTCNIDRALVCMARTRAVAVSPTVRSGKKIWQSTAFMVGTQTPDARCQFDRPAGVAAAVAFVSFTDRPAASVLSLTDVYVRPDGTRVGTGAQLAAGLELDSGIWQRAGGGYSASVVWTGSPLASAAGTAESTCADWTSPAMPMSLVGWSPYDGPTWWTSFHFACDVPFSLYCVEP